MWNVCCLAFDPHFFSFRLSYWVVFRWRNSCVCVYELVGEKRCACKEKKTKRERKRQMKYTQKRQRNVFFICCEISMEEGDLP